MSRPVQHVQRLLTGMPERRPQLAVHSDGEGAQLVVAGRGVVLFGPFGRADLGARNLAIVSLTQMGFAVNDVAAAFGLRPGTVSGLRTAFRRGGSAAVVKVSGRPATLDADTVERARALIAAGWTQQQVGEKFGVGSSAVSHALTRHRAAPPAGPAPALELPLASTGAAGQDDSQAERDDSESERDDSEGERGQEREAGGGLAAGPGATAPAGQERAAAPRIAAGTFECRYAGAMLAHAYLDRAGIGPIFTGLDGGPWRRFDQAQIATFTVTALLLGVSSVEGIKALIRSAAGPLTGTAVSPGVDALRPRLAAIADTTDVPALQTALATAMLAMPGHAGGLFYVDDHFVPYTGARPVAMGHNGKRDRCEKGRADTLICDARGRAVCFTSAEPTHLSKTMQPALRQLRQIVPDGPVLLGFDRGGAYAEAFTACHDLGIDFLTYRRGKPATATATPVTHQVRRGRKTIQVTLADEEIVFSDDYTGPCRQLTLYERAPGCTCPQTADQAGHCPHLTLILQVLTSDLTASAPDLLFALKGRWVIENAFKYLGFYGIDWLADYHADITVHTKLIDNPARKDANAAIRAAKAARADAERALGALLTATAPAAGKNAALPAAHRRVSDTERQIRELTAARDQIPVRLPANLINPAARRALQRTHRRGLLMALRLLAYNADTWLADHLNVYLQDPNEYRAITRALMHQPGAITYTSEQVTVTLDAHHAPRINRALALFLDEINAAGARIPGDPRPLTYQLAGS
jgi:transposase